jgi:hypothetical protein
MMKIQIVWLRDSQTKNNQLFLVVRCSLPATGKGRAGTPVPQDWVTYFLDIPQKMQTEVSDVYN